MTYLECREALPRSTFSAVSTASVEMSTGRGGRLLSSSSVLGESPGQWVWRGGGGGVGFTGNAGLGGRAGFRGESGGESEANGDSSFWSRKPT